jgi:hypothetical protein
MRHAPKYVTFIFLTGHSRRREECVPQTYTRHLRQGKVAQVRETKRARFNASLSLNKLKIYRTEGGTQNKTTVPLKTTAKGSEKGRH